MFFTSVPANIVLHFRKYCYAIHTYDGCETVLIDTPGARCCVRNQALYCLNLGSRSKMTEKNVDRDVKPQTNKHIAWELMIINTLMIAL